MSDKLPTAEEWDAMARANSPDHVWAVLDVYDAAMAEFEAECNGDDAAWDEAHERLLDTCRRAKEGR